MTTNLFTTVCAAPPHTQLQALKRSVLALAVIGFGSTTLASVKAAQYQTATKTLKSLSTAALSTPTPMALSKRMI